MMMLIGIHGNAVYLGAYDNEEAAAHAYNLATLKYWGQDTIINFPLLTYHIELKQIEGQPREEYSRSLRRKSSGFSQEVSKYRGVASEENLRATLGKMGVSNRALEDVMERV